jgi:hypothetical protein
MQAADKANKILIATSDDAKGCPSITLLFGFYSPVKAAVETRARRIAANIAKLPDPCCSLRDEARYAKRLFVTSITLPS